MSTQLKIAIIVSDYPLDISSPILNIINLLIKNYELDIYIKNVCIKNKFILQNKKIKIINLSTTAKFKDKIINKSKFRDKIINQIKFRDKIIISNIFYNFTMLILKIKNFFIKKKYKVLISFDPQGFILCKNIFKNSKPFYYSLELYLSYESYYPEEVKKNERRNINNIEGLIIQSEEREKLFREDYNLKNDIPSIIIPVTYSGEFIKTKNNILKNKLKIGKNKKIALHLGGITKDLSCIEIAEIFSKFEDWILLFQGVANSNYLNKLKSLIKKNKYDNIIISEKTYNNIEEVFPIIMSCDVGIAWYPDISLNFSTAGRSSGKISAYLKFGLPIIAKKYPSTVDAIERTGCGICINDFYEIPNAIRKIEDNYEFFKENEKKEFYKNYYLKNYENKLLEFLKL